MSFGPLEITTIFVSLLILVSACVGAYVIVRYLAKAIARHIRR